MAMTQKLTRREKRLWVGPQSMSGPGLRAAVKLPTGALVTATLACSIAAATATIVADDRGWPASSGFLGAAAAFWVCLFVLSRYAQARRRRLGLVQVTQPQFDLLMALSQVAAVRIDEARRLHDDLVAAIADPLNRDADVAVIVTRMHQLLDRANTTSG